MKKYFLIFILFFTLSHQKAEASFFDDLYNFFIGPKIETQPKNTTASNRTNFVSPTAGEKLLNYFTDIPQTPPVKPNVTNTLPRYPVDDFNQNTDAKKAIQKFLGVKDDGNIGPVTRDAIANFEKQNNLGTIINGKFVPFIKQNSNVLNEKTLEKLDGEMDNKNKKIPVPETKQQLGQGKATFFGHLPRPGICDIDKADRNLSASGVVLNRSGKAIPAVAIWKGKMGDAVYVLNTSNKVCKVFPLLERGPGKGPTSAGVVIDLTGSAFQIMKGQTPCTQISNNAGNSSDKKYDEIGHINVLYGILKGVKIKPGEVLDCEN